MGYKAITTTDDNMILGNNFVKVGIGLSGVAGGPRSKLEINAGTKNESGLQFTQLNSSSEVAYNISLKVLSVDEKGKVILVENKNYDEKILNLEKEIAVLKKQVNDLLAFVQPVKKSN